MSIKTEIMWVEEGADNKSIESADLICYDTYLARRVEVLVFFCNLL